jgi:hypothetical protein
MGKTSSAYGHQINLMSELAKHRGFSGAYTKATWVPEKSYAYTTHVSPAHWSPNCSGRNCDNEPTYASRYLYTTGRAGRVTDRIQYWCKACAEAWAKRHSLPPPKHNGLITVGEYLVLQGRKYPTANAEGLITEQAFAEANLPMMVSCARCEHTMPCTEDLRCTQQGTIFCGDCAEGALEQVTSH